jgi:hypothetical protein
VEDAALAHVAERPVDLDPERAREQRVVAELRVRVEREVLGG